MARRQPPRAGRTARLARRPATGARGSAPSRWRPGGPGARGRAHARAAVAAGGPAGGRPAPRESRGRIELTSSGSGRASVGAQTQSRRSPCRTPRGPNMSSQRSRSSSVFMSAPPRPRWRRGGAAVAGAGLLAARRPSGASSPAVRPSKRGAAAQGDHGAAATRQASAGGRRLIARRVEQQTAPAAPSTNGRASARAGGARRTRAGRRDGRGVGPCELEDGRVGDAGRRVCAMIGPAIASSASDGARWIRLTSRYSPP